MNKKEKLRLREAAKHALSVEDWGYDVDNFHDEATPMAVLALLDEIEAKDKQIAELKSKG